MVHTSGSARQKVHEAGFVVFGDGKGRGDSQNTFLPPEIVVISII